MDYVAGAVAEEGNSSSLSRTAPGAAAGAGLTETIAGYAGATGAMLPGD